MNPSPIHLLIRHAESEGNVGAITHSPQSIQLTECGHQQAAALAAGFIHQPDLIIVSPYQRTQQTAAPLIARFPQVPLQTWPVQEFTYLNTKAHAGTTEQQRAIHAQAYWERCDPHWRDGAGAESFADFIQRIDTLGQRLREHRRLRVVVFTHGYFIKGFQLRSDYSNDAIDTAFMARFREVRRTGLLANAQVLEL